MREITALRIGRGRRKRVNVFLDSRFAFSLESEVAVKEGLQVGQELSTNQVEVLAKSDHFHRCLNAASRYLGYRPRSESEIRGRLQRHGFDGDCIEAVIAKLKEQGLVDELGNLQDAIKIAGEMVGIEGFPKTVKERKKKISWFDLLTQKVNDLLELDQSEKLMPRLEYIFK